MYCFFEEFFTLNSNQKEEKNHSYFVVKRKKTFANVNFLNRSAGSCHHSPRGTKAVFLNLLSQKSFRSSPLPNNFRKKWLQKSTKKFAASL